MAERRIIWSYRSKIDLYNILEFFFKRNGNKDYSRKLNNQFRAAVSIISKHPNIGIKTDIKNVRNLIINNYCIFYRVQKDCIEILAIWDSRQNPVERKFT